MPFGAFRNGIPKCFDDPIFQNKKFEEKQSYMNGLEIFNFAIRKEPSAFMQLLQYANFKKEDLDFVFFHQANKNIVANISRRLNLDEKIAPNDTITKYGNLNACTIPATICDTLNTCKQPLKKNLKVVLGGFGAGLSWANALITLDTNFKCKEVQIYQKETK